MIDRNLSLNKVYIIAIVAGLFVGTVTAYVSIDKEENQNLCKDMGQEIQQNVSEQVNQVNCHPPGVISIESIPEEIGADLQCVCAVRDMDDQITIQPVYRGS